MFRVPREWVSVNRGLDHQIVPQWNEVSTWEEQEEPFITNFMPNSLSGCVYNLESNGPQPPSWHNEH